MGKVTAEELAEHLDDYDGCCVYYVDDISQADEIVSVARHLVASGLSIVSAGRQIDAGRLSTEVSETHPSLRRYGYGRWRVAVEVLHKE